MTFSVRNIPRAKSDIRSITNYIRERSRRGAAAWLNAWGIARKRLAKNAESCGRADENDHFDIEVNQVLFRTRHGRVDRLVFTIVGNEVLILRVRGSGQAPIEPSDI